MREILFRGKRLDNGEWVQGDLYHRNEEVLITNYYSGFTLAVVPETVGQYTGLKDKNGIKIFEGDIINGYTFGGTRDYRNAVVYWDESLICFRAGERSLFGKHVADIYEIIGNIQDSPNFWEGGTKQCL